MKRRLGIIGGGNISESHCEAADQIEGLEVRAIYGQNEERVATLARKFGGEAFTELEEFLGSPLDLVAIGSPSGLHADQGIAAAGRGLHVLTEKPIDVTVERARALVDSCEEAGVKLGVFFQDRVAPELLRLEQALSDGTLGDPILATAHVKWYRPPEYYGDSKWRGTWALDGGGAVMNQGIHTVDLLLWLLGEVRSVYGRTATQLHSIETEDTAVALVEFKNGALATLEATTAAYPGQPRRLYLSGTRGTAFVEHDRLVSIQVPGEEAAAETDEQTGERNLSESSPVVSEVGGHRRILEDFLEAIEENREPICSGREGLRSVQLVEALYQSAEKGQPVFFE